MPWDVPATEADRNQLSYDWGVTWPGWPDWPWTTRIRILMVTDGRITAGYGPDEFGLGYVIDTLRDPSFAWWVTFDVTFKDRDEGFRFTEAGFDINHYDQIWFFGDWPGEAANSPEFGDDQIEAHPDFEHMEDAEVEVIAAWMNARGGVFATGDHALLGASMCHKIPRVRSMRKWTRAQGVPSFNGPDRHETLQGLPTISQYAAEGDRYPQTIYPVYRRDTTWPFVFGQWPHPILCGPTGVIDEFPDHMHEGSVVEDDQVVQNGWLVPGSGESEYPTFEILVSPAVTGGVIGDPRTIGRRPLPKVIAYGMTTNPEQARRPFPLVGVYDGDWAHVGRVVVDSTWHHWFSMNLVGLRADAPGFFRNMQAYYRNIGIWLATPAQRTSMLFWATWGVLVGSQPGLFHPALGVYGMGKRAVDVLGRTAPQCIVSELVGPLIASGDAPSTPREEPVVPWQELTRPPAALVNEAVIGGIATGMFPLAQQHIEERAKGRTPRIEPEAIRDAAIEGIGLGMKTLRATVSEAAEQLEGLAGVDFEKTYRDILDSIQVGESFEPSESEKGR